MIFLLIDDAVELGLSHNALAALDRELLKKGQCLELESCIESVQTNTAI